MSTESTLGPNPQHMPSIGFFVSGQGVLARLAIENARILGFNPSGVVLDTTADIHLDQWCRGHGIASLRLSSPKVAAWEPEVSHFLDARRGSHWILTFSRILPPNVLKDRKGFLINVHEALLPAFPGLRPLDQAANHGVRFAGATMHEVTELVDSGPIIAQCVVPALPGDSSGTLGQRLFPNLRLMYLQVVRWIAEDRLVSDFQGGWVVRDASYDSSKFSPALESLIVNEFVKNPTPRGVIGAMNSVDCDSDASSTGA